MQASGYMKVVKKKEEVRDALEDISRIGFVPTMGALHEGHISLIDASRKLKLYTVCSIFINPTQFNNATDLDAYPIDIQGDLKLLEAAGCDLVFIPNKDEVYTQSIEDPKYLHDFGALETNIEGAFRPGHFKGVGQVVHILFEIVQPHSAFFGEKDFQQLQVIRKLVDMCNLDIDIVGLPTVRESDGLAMSSRNRRLTPLQRSHANLLYEALKYAADELGQSSVEDINEHVEDMFKNDPELRLEYFEIIHASNFERMHQFEGQKEVRGVISAYAGEVRLIDNKQLA